MFRYAANMFSFIIGCVVAVIGTVFMAAGFAMFWKDYRVQNYGIAATATVVETWQKTEMKSRTAPDGRRRSDQERRVSSYFMTFAFTDPAGIQHKIKQGVNREVLENFSQGASVPIVYLPDRGKTARLSREANPKWWVGGLVMCGIAAPFFLTGWFLVGRALWKSSRRIRLLKTGLPVMGEVVRLLADHKTRIRGRHPCSVSYRFTHPGGKVLEGQSEYIPHRMENRFAPGTPILVVYDPKDFERHEPDIYGIRGTAG
jgi:hypothetical protein